MRDRGAGAQRFRGANSLRNMANPPKRVDKRKSGRACLREASSALSKREPSLRIIRARHARAIRGEEERLGYLKESYFLGRVNHALLLRATLHSASCVKMFAFFVPKCVIQISCSCCEKEEKTGVETGSRSKCAETAYSIGSGCDKCCRRSFLRYLLSSKGSLLVLRASPTRCACGTFSIPTRILPGSCPAYPILVRAFTVGRTSRRRGVAQTNRRSHRVLPIPS